MSDRSHGSPRSWRTGAAVLDLEPLCRVLAQVDVSYSNSIIEAWWRSLRHQWLYLNQLIDIAAVRKSVSWYVIQHNEALPHAAFDEQMPDEMCFGRGDGVNDQLARRCHEARQKRLDRNRHGGMLPLSAHRSRGTGGMKHCKGRTCAGGVQNARLRSSAFAPSA